MELILRYYDAAPRNPRSSQRELLRTTKNQQKPGGANKGAIKPYKKNELVSARKSDRGGQEEPRSSPRCSHMMDL